MQTLTTNLIPHLHPEDPVLDKLLSLVYDLCLFYDNSGQANFTIDDSIRTLEATIQAISRLQSPINSVNNNNNSSTTTILSSNTRALRGSNNDDSDEEDSGTSVALVDVENLLVKAKELKLARSLNDVNISNLNLSNTSTDSLALELLKQEGLTAFEQFCGVDDALVDRTVLAYIKSLSHNNAIGNSALKIIYKTARSRSTKYAAAIMVRRPSDRSERAVRTKTSNTRRGNHRANLRAQRAI